MAQLAKPTQSPTRWREASTPRRMRHSIVIALHSERSSVDGSADSGIAAEHYVAGPPSDGYPNDIAAREHRRSVIWTRHPSVDHVRRASSYSEYDGSVSSCYATRRDRTIGCVYGDNEPGERPWRARRIGRVALDRAYWIGCRSHRDGDPRHRLRRNCAAEREARAHSEPGAATPERRSHEPTVDDQCHENVIGDRLPQSHLRFPGAAERSGETLGLWGPPTITISRGVSRGWPAFDGLQWAARRG